jgi:hypothetical protein
VEITIKFVSSPPGATVRQVDSNESVGITPFARRFPRDHRMVTFEFARPGFAPVTQDIELAGDDAVAASLTPLAAPAPVVTPPPVPAPAAPVAPGPVRKHASAKRVAPPPDLPLDRNRTLDVFDKK